MVVTIRFRQRVIEEKRVFCKYGCRVYFGSLPCDRLMPWQQEVEYNFIANILGEIIIQCYNLNGVDQFTGRANRKSFYYFHAYVVLMLRIIQF